MPSFGDSEGIRRLIDNEKDLEIFFEFILSPFKIQPQEKAIKKFGKTSKPLGVELRRNGNPKLLHKVSYNPDQQNPYYLRAQKMLFVFLFRKNYLALKNLNPFHIDCFYRVYLAEVMNKENCRADMCHALYLVQYFLSVDPVASIRNIVKHHVVYELLGNIEILLAKETLIGLLTPGDGFFKIQDKDRKCLYEYLEVAGFGSFLADCACDFKISKVIQERRRVESDEQVQGFLKNFQGKNKCKSESKIKNMLQLFFHTFLNLTTKGLKFHKQPEEIYSTIHDIDRLSSYTPPTSNYERRKGFMKKDSHVGNASFVIEGYDLDDVQEVKKKNFLANFYHNHKVDGLNFDLSDADANSNSPAEPHSVSNHELTGAFKKASLYDTPLPLTRRVRRFRMIVRTVMCANLFMERPQQISKLKKAGISYKIESYPEKIQVGNPELRIMQADPKLYFEKCMKVEGYSCKVLEIILAVVDTMLLQKNSADLITAIRLNKATDYTGVETVFFGSDKLVFELLKMFLTKIQYHLENKTLFMSGYLAGRILVKICHNMYSVLTQALLRHQLAGHIGHLQEAAVVPFRHLQDDQHRAQALPLPRQRRAEAAGHRNSA